MDYTCTKCNGHKVKLEKRGNQTAVLCAECGKWLKWAGKSEVAKIQAELNSSIENIKEECATYADIEKLVELVLECNDRFGTQTVFEELARMNTESRIDSIPKLIYAFEMM